MIVVGGGLGPKEGEEGTSDGRAAGVREGTAAVYAVQVLEVVSFPKISSVY